MIGDDVEITIVDVRGDKVRLGIAAPKSIPVHRREVYDAIQREKKAAKESQPQVQAEAEKEVKEEPESEPQEPVEKHVRKR